jgi:hypothetical protein
MRGKSLRKYGDKIVFAASALCLFAGVYVWDHLIKQNSPNRDDQKLTEIRTIAVSLPVPPNSWPKESSDGSKSSGTFVSQYYGSVHDTSAP